MAVWTRLELAASALTGQRSNQLSYQTKISRIACFTGCIPVRKQPTEPTLPDYTAPPSRMQEQNFGWTALPTALY